MTRHLFSGVIGAFVAGVLFAAPAFGQTSGEARVSFIQGQDSDFRYRGLVGGLGVLVRDRIGVEGEFGLVGDNSDEGALAPTLSAGATWRITRPGKFVPFLGTGFSRLGDTGAWYGGGGAHIHFSPRMALRLEARATWPVTTFGFCVANERNDCSTPERKAVFVNAGLVFGFAR